MYKRIWNHNKIAYGGDYNPEQWGEDIWEEDMRLFHLAGIDTVTLNVFSWATLQPDENTYRFDKLDRIMDFVKNNGLHVCLATSTGAHPAWMAKKYPEIADNLCVSEGESPPFEDEKYDKVVCYGEP